MNAPLKSELDKKGVAGPFPLQSPDLAKRVLTAFFFLKGRRNPHARSARVAALLEDSALVDVVEGLCGTGLAVWRSAFFAKRKGAPEIGWHHDKHYQTANSDTVLFNELQQHFSILIALRSMGMETGRLEVIPGTHLEDDRYKRDTRPYHMRAGGEHFLSDIPPALVESREGLDIPSAHFIVFHSALLHRSLAHPGGPPRVGLALRLTHRDNAVPKELASAAEIVPFGPR